MTSPPPAHLFTHEAMNTTFSLRICEPDQPIAAGMARECFEQLDLLESRLSRFIDGSDVSRINTLPAGETLYLSESTHQCLLAALDAYARTGGLFDITLGSRIAHQKSGDTGVIPPLVGRLTIHPDVAAVTCETPGREIDLGGIGKGFALDQLKQLLIDWGAEGGLLAAGASSLLVSHLRLDDEIAAREQPYQAAPCDREDLAAAQAAPDRFEPRDTLRARRAGKVGAVERPHR